MGYAEYVSGFAPGIGADADDVDLEGQFRGFSYPDIEVLRNEIRNSMQSVEAGPRQGLARMQATFTSATFDDRIFAVIPILNQSWILYEDVRSAVSLVSGAASPIDQVRQARHIIRGDLDRIGDWEDTDDGEVTFGGRIEVGAWKYSKTANRAPGSAIALTYQDIWDIDLAAKKALFWDGVTAGALVHGTNAVDLFYDRRQNLGIA